MPGMMGVISERIKQGLGVGRDFETTQLDAHMKMLADASEYAGHLQRYQRELRGLHDCLISFVQASGKFAVEAPYPRVWKQSDMTSEATAAHTIVPDEHATLFVHEMHLQLAENTPRTVHVMLEEAMAPLEIWLKAFESGKERVKSLDNVRLQYDVQRRKLHNIVKDPSLPEPDRQDAYNEAMQDPVVEQFQLQEQRVYAQLTWLVTQAARIKAFCASIMLYISNAASGYVQPPGLLVPFPVEALEEGGTREGSEAGGVEHPRSPMREESRRTAPPQVWRSLSELSRRTTESERYYPAAEVGHEGAGRKPRSFLGKVLRKMWRQCCD